MSDRVVKVIYSADRKRRVHIIERSDGSFTFEDWVFVDEPRETTWFPTDRRLQTLADSAERAEAEARERVGWLALEPGAS